MTRSNFRKSATGITGILSAGIVLMACGGCDTGGQSPPSTPLPKQPLPSQAELPEVIRTTEPPPVDPLKLRDDALTALESGDSGEALQLIRQAVAAAPDDPESIFVMARVLAERNRFPEAIRMLDNLAAEVPDVRLPAMGQTAQWHVLQGRWEEAERCYRNLLAEITDADARMVDRMLAQLLLRQGRRLEATTHLRELCRFGDVDEFELRSMLIALHPLPGESVEEDEWKPIGALGRARYQISQGDWQAALEQLDPSKAKRPAEAALRGASMPSNRRMNHSTPGPPSQRSHSNWKRPIIGSRWACTRLTERMMLPRPNALARRYCATLPTHRRIGSSANRLTGWGSVPKRKPPPTAPI